MWAAKRAVTEGSLGVRNAFATPEEEEEGSLPPIRAKRAQQIIIGEDGEPLPEEGTEEAEEVHNQTNLRNETHCLSRLC